MNGVMHDDRISIKPNTNIKNKEQILIKTKKYREENKDKIKEQRRLYRLKNKEKLRQQKLNT